MPTLISLEGIIVTAAETRFPFNSLTPGKDAEDATY